jgi:hypothetical protein
LFSILLILRISFSDFGDPHLVMPGLKREARLRAYDPGIHPSSEDSCEEDGLPGQARQ